MTEDTIFSKIVKGEIPSDIVYQDDLVTAFRDVNPQAPTHILIVSNKAIPTVADVTPEDEQTLGRMFIAAARLAEDEGVAADGYPWFVGTAFLHSIMVQERRDMLKVWNVFLIVLTFFMTIVATYMTRSGVVESVHAFAGGVVGDWFLWFMLAIALFAAFVTALRLPSLRGKHRLESFFSREAAFFFNNLILLALCATVYFLSMFEKISHDWFMETRKTGIPGVQQWQHQEIQIPKP